MYSVSVSVGEDDHAKRTLKLETVMSVNIRPMKSMSRAQKDHNEVERTNPSRA